MKKLYGAFDLHSSNNYLAVSDEQDQRVYQKRLPNHPDVILAELEPYRSDLVGLVVESTYNWYWLVDLLIEEGWRVHLVNPSGIQKYKGLKHSNDRHDAFWLAHLLRLGILPEGYIYPKKERPFRDLRRKRGHLVRLRTSLINSLQGMIHRNYGVKLNSNNIKAIKEDYVAPFVDRPRGFGIKRPDKQGYDRLFRETDPQDRKSRSEQNQAEEALSTSAHNSGYWQDTRHNNHAGGWAD